MAKVLYVFDDINYPSGARKATAMQARALAAAHEVWLFSLEEPDAAAAALFGGLPFLAASGSRDYQCLNHVAGKVLLGRGYTLGQRALKLGQVLAILAGRTEAFYTKKFTQLFGAGFAGFDVVIVVSEASKLRGVAAGLQGPKTIQWVHTDYQGWSGFSAWTQGVTKWDEELYGRFSAVALISRRIREGFVARHPGLAGKTLVIRNMIDGDGILRQAEAENPLPPAPGVFQIVTVGRLEQEKNYDGILNVAARLKGAGRRFRWVIVGGGQLGAHLAARVEKEGLADVVTLAGPMENPYPVLRAADVFCLFSLYEGTPVTIDEAGVLGVPVVATDVGGIAEQLQGGGAAPGGRAGVLVPGSEERLFEVLCGFIQNPTALDKYKSSAENWRGRNDEALRTLLEFIDG